MPVIKRYTIFLCLVICSFISFAQNYCTINKQSLNYFYCSNNNYKPIRIKTVQIINNDTVLYPVKESYYKWQYPCDYIDTTCFIGQKIIIKPNGINVFYNIEGQEIIIYTLANQGDKWTMFLCKDSSRFEAKVDSIYFGLIFSNLKDSIKVISLKYYDKHGKIINHPANNANISISKNYGLLTFWNFISLPEKTPNYSSLTYKLVGMSHPQVGYQNLNASLIYNFNIGDEIHTQFHYYDSYMSPIWLSTTTIIKDTFCIRKIIDKLETEEAFYYTLQRHYFAIYYYYSNFYPGTIIRDTSNIEDTVIEKYSKQNNDLDRLPYESDITFYGCTAGTGYRLNSYIPLISFNTIRTKQNDIGNQVKFQIFDTCLESCQEMAYAFENYYDGLGGPFYYRSDETEIWTPPGEDWYEEYELVYYKKGSNTWGAPLKLKDTGVKPEQKSFFMAPNPASDRIIISSRSNDQICQLIVTDISGNTIKHSNAINSSVYEMDCSDLHDGLYVICIITGTEEIYHKQLLISR